MASPTRKKLTDRFRKRRADPFTRATGGRLDLVKTPPYDMSDDYRTELGSEVDALVKGLLPNAVDAYNRHVLDDWLDARSRQLVARLDAEREERQALGEALIGLAREETTRRKVPYDADLTRLRIAEEVVAVAWKQLTGTEWTHDPNSPASGQADRPAVSSTLGRVLMAPDWEPEKRPARAEPTDQLPPTRTHEENGNGNVHER